MYTDIHLNIICNSKEKNSSTPKKLNKLNNNKFIHENIVRSFKNKIVWT